jgi:LmbE family N-acetylglucosaminyl deacetylase
VLRLTPGSGEPLRVLAVGAHPDDIEIGCGGTLLRLVSEGSIAAATWLVLSGDGARADEARAGAAAVLAGVTDQEIRVDRIRDGYFPARYEQVKDALESVASRDVDLVLVPRHDDAHQDHRLIGELALTAFRDHLILEYEIPKYDGDLRSANLYATLSEETVARKVEVLMQTFASQLQREWFTPETFRALMRLRGIEARAASGYAEAFVCGKGVF